MWICAGSVMYTDHLSDPMPAHLRKICSMRAHFGLTLPGFQGLCAAIARVSPPTPTPWVALETVLQDHDWYCEAL